LNIHVNELLFPLPREHGCHCKQTQRGKAGLSADEFQSVPETPECVRIIWINEEDLHLNAPDYELNALMDTLNFIAVSATVIHADVKVL
jgi:hypothetical protein